MNEFGWRWISASVAGTSHSGTGNGCQDNHFCGLLHSEQGTILFAVVSDGAGSASRSAQGSQLLCDVLLAQASEFFSDRGRVADLNPRMVANWIHLFRDEVILQAHSEGLSDREYACTVVAAVIGPQDCAFFQIGDGALVYSDASSMLYSLAFWPERGEYENTTFFATQPNVLDQLQFTYSQIAVNEVALFSDGLQRLALDYQAKAAYQPFFRNVFAPIHRAVGNEEVSKLNAQLASYLDSPRINERTDDDKTLILATTTVDALANLSIESPNSK